MFISKTDKDDKKLLEGRIEAEAAVIGCVMKDLLLLDDYKITEEQSIISDKVFFCNFIVI